MNEKLRDLSKQAYEWCIENAEGSPVAWEWEDKVAELIVKECIDQVGDFCGEVPMGNNVYKVVDAEGVLKQHFGIKE